MHGQGEGANAIEVHFASSLTIQTLQTSSSNAPFANVSTLERITSEPNITVSFKGNNGADPTLRNFFAQCSSLVSLDGLSAWNVGNVNGNYCMYSMFNYCSSLTSLDGLSAWDVGNVNGNYCMYSMFNYCSSLTSLDGLSAWNVGNVSGESCMNSMFYGCTSLTSLDGLSAWNVGNVSGNYCMQYMFNTCTNLTSLDGLSAWNVGNVSDDYGMNYMFGGCTNLVSLDAIASWNIDGAIRSSGGVSSMFSGCSKIASITLGDVSGFKLDSSMDLPSANWWTVAGETAYPTTSSSGDQNLYAQSADTAINGYRWQKCTTEATNPMQTVTNVQAIWPLTENLVYNGLLQTIRPLSVTADGTTLEEGRDFYISYTNSGSELSAIKNAGTYTAHIVLRGAYIYSGTDALPSTSVTIEKLNLAQNQNVEAFCIPSIFAYTGSAIEPKTMVRLYLREDTNPKDPTKSISIYSYLIQSTGDIDKRGDYSVSYANNIDPGTADATVQGVTPAGLSSSNLEGKAIASFKITGDYTVTFDSNGGSAVESKEAAAGYPVKKPEDPTRDGYTFLYWCTDEALTDKFDFSTPITADITLYAKWEETPDPTPPDPEPTPTSKEGWEQDDTGWRYFVDNAAISGWRWIDDAYGAHWYFFGDDTYMVTSTFLKDNGYTYWVCSTGPMITKLWQWIDNEWYGFWWDGKMCTGWVWDTDWNAWFYCYQNGIMAKSTWIDAYWVDWRGIWLH